ncbi:MAG: hypothetical protein ACHQJ6_01580 [Candidatus Berkiellales bacterium]
MKIYWIQIRDPARLQLTEAGAETPSRDDAWDQIFKPITKEDQEKAQQSIDDAWNQVQERIRRVKQEKAKQDEAKQDEAKQETPPKSPRGSGGLKK